MMTDESRLLPANLDETHLDARSQATVCPLGGQHEFAVVQTAGARFEEKNEGTWCNASSSAAQLRS